MFGTVWLERSKAAEGRLFQRENELKRAVDKRAGSDTVTAFDFQKTTMANTKSAQRRVRSSARKAARNHSVKSRLKTLEKKYLGLLQDNKKDEAAAALRDVVSALDKASKGGVLHWATVDRKKSRLSLRLAAAAK
jgi:small subunit ribosomal protein S20